MTIGLNVPYHVDSFIVTSEEVRFSALIESSSLHRRILSSGDNSNMNASRMSCRMERG